MTSLLEKSTTKNAFRVGRELTHLGKALESVGAKLPPETAAVVARQIVATMERTTDTYALPSLRKALGSLSALDKVSAVAILKSIMCVDETRDHVLTIIENHAGRKFNGSVWKALDWLDEQGIAVNSIPRWPLEK